MIVFKKKMAVFVKESMANMKVPNASQTLKNLHYLYHRMEAYMGKWKVDHDFDENIDAFLEANSVPEDLREKMKEVEITLSLEEVPDEPGKYGWKFEIEEVDIY